MGTIIIVLIILGVIGWVIFKLITNNSENNETIIGILYSDYDGNDIINYLFDYWINNIKKCQE